MARRTAVTIPLDETALLLTDDDHYPAVGTPFAHSAELLNTQEFLLIQRIFMEGVSYRDATKEFEITEGACRKRVERILQKLKDRWEED